MFPVGRFQETETLGIGANFGCQQRIFDLTQNGILLDSCTRRRPRQHLGGQGPFGVQTTHGACKYGIGNGGGSDPQIEGNLARPFARPFLFGRVQNQVHQSTARFRVGVRQDVARDAHQVAGQFPLVPFVEHRTHLGRAHAQQVVHQPIGFADALHVSILNAVVHHLHEVARAARAHPFTAGLTVIGFGGNRLQHGLQARPGG